MTLILDPPPHGWCCSRFWTPPTVFKLSDGVYALFLVIRTFTSIQTFRSAKARVLVSAKDLRLRSEGTAARQPDDGAQDCAQLDGTARSASKI